MFLITTFRRLFLKAQRELFHDKKLSLNGYVYLPYDKYFLFNDVPFINFIQLSLFYRKSLNQLLKTKNSFKRLLSFQVPLFYNKSFCVEDKFK